MKLYADERNHARKSKVTIGDSVLVKQPKENKLSTPFDPKPYQVTNKKGTMVTAEREDKSITWNSSFFKPIRGPVQIPSTNDATIYRENPIVTCYGGHTVKDDHLIT